mmetsp:Transcript_40205/g.94527  ORF Transcript_40205/g.94527 Transcript_40205/m.94527 type:complete len:93 (+) Transcript_40205:41-319(+)|eukprot:CAMPEP_0113315718 /NCGR_PEP_ID=MMETSP0010_2-20120614/11276_1 /TAXON_ID=216773 ORGANISM="Corethron hystrix, Strain 308" /NCGR_SAMPLE_ID=MMETSP0010_2 /ASSEMBLY_ACC=CAM_ASM_000155 /LENGTH=92 /DNA_ID=CAMNT_0000172279 /DNA_START=43 /DNA_END=321 /DNA_ORIENTATION=+ /assembly_acc=CAM_ASM_000155
MSLPTGVPKNKGRQQIPSEEIVTSILYSGLIENGLTSAAIGFAAGAVASIVVARSGGGRKAVTAFGTGVGIGQAWTATNERLEETLSEVINK